MQEVYIHHSCLKEDLIKTFMVENPHCLAGIKVIDELGKVEEGDVQARPHCGRAS